MPFVLPIMDRRPKIEPVDLAYEHPRLTAALAAPLPPPTTTGQKCAAEVHLPGIAVDEEEILEEIWESASDEEHAAMATPKPVDSHAIVEQLCASVFKGKLSLITWGDHPVH